MSISVRKAAGSEINADMHIHSITYLQVTWPPALIDALTGTTIFFVFIICYTNSLVCKTFYVCSVCCSFFVIFCIDANTTAHIDALTDTLSVQAAPLRNYNGNDNGNGNGVGVGGGVDGSGSGVGVVGGVDFNGSGVRARSVRKADIDVTRELTFSDLEKGTQYVFRLVASAFPTGAPKVVLSSAATPAVTLLQPLKTRANTPPPPPLPPPATPRVSSAATATATTSAVTLEFDAYTHTGE
jgi:hypothetical protein